MSDHAATALKQSPLHARHVAAGAKFAEFGGWSMPLEYAAPANLPDARGGVLAEHDAVRTSVAVFDVSHLGKASVTGPGAKDFLNRCLTNDLDRITPGQAQYTMLCNDAGGVVDDLIAYLKADDEVFLIPNAANTATVVEILAAAAPAGITVTDQHDDFAVIAIQGPHADDVVAAAGYPTGHDYMSFVAVGDGSATVCRTGYTGERGYELVVPALEAPAVWDAVMTAGAPYGIRPAGLGARDTLRTEMGYALHGHEITPAITPVQARLGWAVGWKKPEFFGREALLAEKKAGPARTARGLVAAGRGIPRPEMVVVDAAGNEIGVVTSGTFSPTRKQGIALALVDSDHTDGETVGVQVRNRVESFVITKPPFVETGVR